MEEAELKKKIIINRIKVINDFELDDKKFKELSKELADVLIQSFGFEMLDKLVYFLPSNKFYKLEYVNNKNK
jgi:hypothetical protein